METYMVAIIWGVVIVGGLGLLKYFDIIKKDCRDCYTESEEDTLEDH